MRSLSLRSRFDSVKLVTKILGASYGLLTQSNGNTVYSCNLKFYPYIRTHIKVDSSILAQVAIAFTLPIVGRLGKGKDTHIYTLSLSTFFWRYLYLEVAFLDDYIWSWVLKAFQLDTLFQPRRQQKEVPF